MFQHRDSARAGSLYGAFRVDPTINFGDFDISFDHKPTSSISNFSRPISIRGAITSEDGRAHYTVPDLSRPSSNCSSRYSGPITPGLDIAPAQFLAGPAKIPTSVDKNEKPRQAVYVDDTNKTPELNLRFSFEDAFSDEQLRSSPFQFRERSSSLTPDSKPLLTPMPTDLQLEIVPKALALDTSRRDTAPRSAPPNVASFADFTQSIAARQTHSRLSQAATLSPGPTPTTPSFQFLRQDPYHCPLHGLKPQYRPRTSGTDAAPTEAMANSVFDLSQPKKKQSAPSIMSTKSTRSIRKGMSRMKRILTGRTADF